MNEPTAGIEHVREAALQALRGVIDPEVGVNIVDLGLVYDVDVNVEDRRVHVRMTMTSPACPLGEQILSDAEQRLQTIDGIDDVQVELVWDPPWGPERMAPPARQALGWGE